MDSNEGINVENLKFDENGLIPAIVQDYHTKKVLTLAYMNAESLGITLREKRTCFWSRSRQALWRKGETSGNTQRVVSIACDCDADALVIEVIKNGPACHLGNDSCFDFPLYRDAESPDFTTDGLYGLLEGRRDERPEGSYTSYLFDKGKEKILKKIGEESSEVLIAAMKEDREETIYELADLCYHAMVLMVHQGIGLQEIRRELASRHVIDKKIKQEPMK